MHKRSGPQYNRGNDPTTAVCKIKNATQKNDTKGFETFFSSFFVDEQSLLLYSGGYLGGGGGAAVPPLVLDQKETRRAENNFSLRPAPPPLSQNLGDRPPPLSEDLDLLLVLLGKKEKWRLCLNRVKPLLEVVAACSSNLRTYLSWSLKNVPLSGGASVYRPLQGVPPGFQTKTFPYPYMAWVPTSLPGLRTQAFKRLIERTSRIQ